MPIIFGRLGDELYEAVYEPDADKRRAAIDAWVSRASETIASNVREELAAYVAWVRAEWPEPLWSQMEKKWRRIQPQYHLVMDIKLRTVATREQPQPKVIDASEPLVPGLDRATRNMLIKQGSLAIKKQSSNSDPAWDDGDDSSGSGRSPNDARSDLMNPSNDAYHAAMDNHANQLNPNNDAYWSSRGR